MSNPHFANMTQYTRQMIGFEGPAKARNPEINLHNRKPYRTKAQKATARTMAHKGKDGAWHSPTPVSYHTAKEVQSIQ